MKLLEAINKSPYRTAIRPSHEEGEVSLRLILESQDGKERFFWLKSYSGSLDAKVLASVISIAEVASFDDWEPYIIPPKKTNLEHDSRIRKLRTTISKLCDEKLEQEVDYILERNEELERKIKKLQVWNESLKELVETLNSLKKNFDDTHELVCQHIGDMRNWK